MDACPTSCAHDTAHTPPPMMTTRCISEEEENVKEAFAVVKGRVCLPT